MKVVYYTATYFLDLSLEIINILKGYVDLHVLIEIAPNYKTSSITNVEHLPEDTLLHPSELLSKEDFNKMEPYLDGLSNVYFVIHKNRGVLSALKASYNVFKYIKRIRPDIVHIEALSARSLGLIPSLIFTKKILITIHDPVPHSGEEDWNYKARKYFIKYFLYYFPISKGFIFYSAFSKSIYEQYFSKDKHKKWVVQMFPFSYLKKFNKGVKKEHKHILFFGRLSPYKGIDILLKAMPSVLQKFPNETLIIAGQSIEGYSLKGEIIKGYENNITIINRYISNEELFNMIMEAKFIVCPYKDATQSGVLMTAFALNTPVVATRVGAFPEYIEENVTSLLTPVNDYKKLSEKILFALNNDFYKQMERHLCKRNETNQWVLNRKVLLEAYNA